MSGKKLFKIAEAAKELGVTPAMVYRWVSLGALKSVGCPPNVGTRPSIRVPYYEIERAKKYRKLGIPLRFTEEQLNALR